MFTMKKLTYFLSLSFLAILFAACGGNTSTPEASLAGFLNELQDLDFNGAKKYSTESTKTVLSTLEGVMKMIPTDNLPKDKKTVTEKNVKCKIDGDRASCVVCMENETCSPEETSIAVVKEGGAWLVSMSKDEMSKDRMNKEDMSSALDEGLDEIDNLDIDLDSIAGDVTNMLDSLGNEIGTIADSLAKKINE